MELDRSSANILIIDDDPDFLKLTALMLKAAPCKIRVQSELGKGSTITVVLPKSVKQNK